MLLILYQSSTGKPKQGSPRCPHNGAQAAGKDEWYICIDTCKVLLLLRIYSLFLEAQAHQQATHASCGDTHAIGYHRGCTASYQHKPMEGQLRTCVGGAKLTISADLRNANMQVDWNKLAEARLR